jgi:squalene-hopene/tetraprenyl-beta-curcumene cyclase
MVACPAGSADRDLGPDPKELRAVLDKAVAYLRTNQGQDGSFSPKLAGPGISAVVAAGLLRNRISAEDPLVAKALGYLEKKVQKDGGIYDKFLANYTTSVALMAFHEANTKGKYDTVIKNATKFLRGMQYDDSRVESGDARFGGAGYDAKSRPDMSNTHYFLEALEAAGVPKDDPAVKRALAFVSRCQNLPGENNDQPFAKKATEDDKGGLVYNPLNTDDNKRDATPQGGLRSAGAMTYAGLKSFLYAGLNKNDPRVKGAVDWIRRHYSLEENPGMGRSGLYYYYHIFAKAMATLGEDRFEDAKKVKHDWRKELFEALKKRQRPDGSWVNTDKGFGEADPNLATAFAMLALSYCEPRKQK